jgi:hypothetical protein
MLNPFPQLLVFGFFAPTLLRVAVAITQWYIAYALFQNKKEIIATTLPIVGKPGEWMCWLAVLITGLIGVALFFGWETQWAAILGVVIALKHGIGARRYHAIVPLSRSTYVLLGIICLSLLVTGAGALAIDLPL